MRHRPRASALAPITLVASAVLLLGCDSEAGDRSAVGGADSQPVPESAASTSSPVVADVDPCSLFSLEELRSALPHLEGPPFPDPTNHQCVYTGAFVQIAPLTRDEVELEHELFGFEPQVIEVPGSDWAVARIDRGDGEAMKMVQALPEELTEGAGKPLEPGKAEVHDLIAIGPFGTISLMPTGDQPLAFGSPEYEALVRLLRLGYSRL